MIENVFDWFNVVGDILSSGLGSICFNFCMVWCGFVDILDDLGYSLTIINSV